MPVKPRMIVAIALLYALSPLFIVLQAAITVNLPIFGPLNIWLKLSPIDVAVLLSYWAAAAAVWSVRKTGWFAFMFLSVFLITSNIVVMILRPQYGPFLVLAYNALLTTVAAVFFHRSIIAPYFTPRLRWWESLPRYQADVFLAMSHEGHDIKLTIRDLSVQGCFVSTIAILTLGAVYKATISCFGRELELKVKVVRDASFGEVAGYGLMFVKVQSITSRKLRQMVQTLERVITTVPSSPHDFSFMRSPKRIVLVDRARIWYAEQEVMVSILDLSAGGCSFISPARLKKEDKIKFRWEGHGLSFETPCDLIWDGTREIDRVYGIAFRPENTRTSRTIRRLVRKLRMIGSQRRQAEAADRAIIEEAALKTPYRHVRRFFDRFKKAGSRT